MTGDRDITRLTTGDRDKTNDRRPPLVVLVVSLFCGVVVLLCCCLLVLLFCWLAVLLFYNLVRLLMYYYDGVLLCNRVVVLSRCIFVVLM